MVDFPYLEESTYVKTRRAFHAIAGILGKVRETLVKPIAKNDNLWLSVSEGGFSVPSIEQYGELEIGCNPEKLIVEIIGNKTAHEEININGKTRREICGFIESAANIDLLGGALDELKSDKVFEIPEEDAKNFHIQFANYNTLISEFHKTVSAGVKTQICLWPHHFDNAFKWFSGKKIDEQDEFMNVGVSNGDDVYELPYIYVTYWPALRKTNTLVIPDGGILFDQEWTGIVLPYEAVNEKKSAEAQKKLIEDFFSGAFATVQRAFGKR